MLRRPTVRQTLTYRQRVLSFLLNSNLGRRAVPESIGHRTGFSGIIEQTVATSVQLLPISLHIGTISYQQQNDLHHQHAMQHEESNTAALIHKAENRRHFIHRDRVNPSVPTLSGR